MGNIDWSLAFANEDSRTCARQVLCKFRADEDTHETLSLRNNKLKDKKWCVIPKLLQWNTKRPLPDLLHWQSRGDKATPRMSNSNIFQEDKKLLIVYIIYCELHVTMKTPRHHLKNGSIGIMIVSQLSNLDSLKRGSLPWSGLWPINNQDELPVQNLPMLAKIGRRQEGNDRREVCMS